MSKEVLHLVQSFLGIQVSNQDKGGIVGAVKLTIEIDHLFSTDRDHIPVVADNGKPVRMFLKTFSFYFVVQSPPGSVEIRLELLNNNPPFQLQLLWIEPTIHHPIRFNFQGGPPAVRSEGEIVGCVVVGGEGVVAAALTGGDVVDLTLLVPGCSLEHHVFQEMRDSGNARLFKTRSNSIPHHGRDYGYGVILTQEEGQPIGQLMSLNGVNMETFRFHV